MEFTHTYIGFNSENARSEPFVFTLSSKEYRMRPIIGQMEYLANDTTHIWKIDMEKNQFEKRMVYIKRAPSERFESAFEVL